MSYRNQSSMRASMGIALVMRPETRLLITPRLRRHRDPELAEDASRRPWQERRRRRPPRR